VAMLSNEVNKNYGIQSDSLDRACECAYKSWSA